MRRLMGGQSDRPHNRGRPPPTRTPAYNVGGQPGIEPDFAAPQSCATPGLFAAERIGLPLRELVALRERELPRIFRARFRSELAPLLASRLARLDEKPLHLPGGLLISAGVLGSV